MKKILLFLALLIPLNSVSGAQIQFESKNAGEQAASHGNQEESASIDFKKLKQLSAPIEIKHNLSPTKIHIRHELVENRPMLRSKLSGLFPSLRRVESGIPADAVELGLDWLLATQNVAGYWGEAYPMRDTLTSIEFLKWMNYEDTNVIGLGVDWMVMSEPSQNDALSRTIIGLSSIDHDYKNSLAPQLATETNPVTGGFGYSKNYQADNLTTALALKALTEAEYFGEDGGDTTAYNALRELLTTQNADGGFGYTQNGESKLYPTEMAVDAVLAYDGLILAYTSGSEAIELEISPVLDAAMNYIKSQQNPDGSFGSGVSETALAYDLLHRRDDYPEANEAGLEYLLNAQNEMGSYNDDPYQTALALKALAKPDLELQTVSVDTDEPNTPAELTIPIKNLGALTSEPFTLEIRLNDADFMNVDVPYSMGKNATINIVMVVEDGFPVGNYDFEFIVHPAEGLSDLNPNNHTQSFSMLFASYDGPLPPEWIGASTSSTANAISLAWLPSPSGTAASYTIYIGTSPGSYFYASPAFASSTKGVKISGVSPDVPYYFNVVASDAAGVRGDYSMESSAIGKSSPSFSASVHGYVASDGDRLADAELQLYYFGDVITTDLNGEFDFTIYPGHYRFTTSHPGYESQSLNVDLLEGEDSEVIFELNPTDDGLSPLNVDGFNATPNSKQVLLSWTPVDDLDFDRYEIFRSSSAASSISTLSPLVTFDDMATSTYLDETILNGLDYYYSIRYVDKFDLPGTESPWFGPVKGNSAPVLDTLSVFQDEDGLIQLSLDAQDAEDNQIELSMEFWNGSEWNAVESATGLGLQSTGTSKSVLWNPKPENPNLDLEDAKLRITAEDGNDVNGVGSFETAPFSIDTKAPQITVNTMSSTDTTPLVSGFVDEPVSTLMLSLAGNSYEVEWDGLNWTAQIDVELETAYYDLAATAEDYFGNIGQDSSSYELTVDDRSPILMSFYGGTGDGSIFATPNLSWDTVHDALSGGTVNSTGTTLVARTGFDASTKYVVERAFLPFDTSALPDDAEIQSAALKVYVSSKSNKDNDGNDFITVVNTNQASTSTLAKGDFDMAGSIDFPLEGTDERKDLTSISMSAVLPFNLNAVGLSWISKNGFTKLGLREGHDVLDSAFTGTKTQYNTLQIRTANYTGTTYDPILDVTYLLPITEFIPAL